MRATAPRTLLKTLLTLAAVLLLAALIGGCGGERSWKAPDGSGDPPGDAVGPATIGPNGGDVTAAGGLITLSFPAGALAEEVEITVAAVTDVPADPCLVSGTCFEFGPDGTEFAEPVPLTIAYEETSIPTDVDESTLRLCKIVGTSWEVVGGFTLDPEANTVSAPLHGFSSYGLAGLPTGGTVLTGNQMLASLDGLQEFQNVTAIEGDLFISASFTESVQLPALTRVTGTLKIIGSGGSPSILTTVNLPALHSVGKMLQVNGCDSLLTLDLPVCESVGHISFYGNNSLEDVSGLSGLRSLNPSGNPLYGAISMVQNHALRNLGGLSGLSGQIKGISLRYNSALESLAGLDGITSLTGGFEIGHSDSLRSLAGLALTNVGGDFFVRDLGQLESLSGLERLHTVVLNLQVEYCDSLPNLEGLSSITHVGKAISLLHNHKLQSLSGLGPIASLDNGALYIESCWELEDISALSHLQYIEHDLRINFCEKLVDLSGLHNLVHVGATLELTHNVDLQNLDGLANLAYSCGEISIQDNQVLEDVSGLLGLRVCSDTGYVCYSFTARRNNCGNSAFWDIVNDFGGEGMVEDVVVIDTNH